MGEFSQEQFFERGLLFDRDSYSNTEGLVRSWTFEDWLLPTPTKSGFSVGGENNELPC